MARPHPGYRQNGNAGLKNVITNFGGRRVARVDEWLSLANRILVFAQRLLDTAEVPVTPQGARDARVIAFALVARTISNLKGALGMIEAGQIIEARTLARCCWENLFWAAALTKKGDKFVRQVVSDDAFSRVKRGRRLMNWSNEQETPQGWGRAGCLHRRTG
jgi:hypothetical protein